MEDKLLSINEVAKYLKIPKSTIYKLSQKGGIPSSKIGKQLRFRLSSIDNWLSKKEGAPEAPDLFLTVSRDKILPKFQSKNILLVDDDKLVLRTITKLLNQQGYNVESAESGKEALKKIEKEKFDLLIADVRMPDMNGIETIKKIRALYNKRDKPQIPEIIITGYMDPEAEREARKLGITDFIHKPFIISDFVKTVIKKLRVRK